MAFNPIGDLSGWLGQQTPSVPGVGGTPSNYDFNMDAVPVPGQPGNWYDPKTGQIIRTDGNGNNFVVGAPNLNQLTAMGTGNQQEQQQVARQLQAQQQQTFQAQNDLAGSLKNTITNPGASSVALDQLSEGLNRINGTQLGNAAGATGENAAAARRTAAQNIAGAEVGLNAQQAALRAQEIANAQTGLAGVLNSQAQTQQAGINNATGAATTYGGQNVTAQGDVTNSNEKAGEFNAKQNSNLLGTLGSGLSSLGGLL